MSDRTLPLVAAVAGTTMMVIGSAQVSAAWLARDIPERDRWTMGAIAAGFVGLGTVLQIMASQELARGAR